MRHHEKMLQTSLRLANQAELVRPLWRHAGRLGQGLRWGFRGEGASCLSRKKCLTAGIPTLHFDNIL